MKPVLLVVDDDPKQLAKIVRAAREAGFEEIVQASNHYEAETKLVNETFQIAVVDLVLSDSDFSPEDGLELVQMIRNAQPECRVIVLTTKLDTDAGIRAMVAGAHDFISSKWLAVNWEELLVQKLKLWKGFVEGNERLLAV
jgi:ActR/RegA family two-component response regulator